MPTLAKSPAAKPAATTLGSDIDSIHALIDKKKKLLSSVKEIDGQIADLESQLMEKMAAAGVDKLTGKKATASVRSSVVANVTDWDTFLAFIYKNKAGHLLQRRVSEPAWREMVELKKGVPGTQPFTKKTLSVTSV